MNKNITNKGFTLIELVIVLSIIAILSSAAIPEYNHYIEKAKKTNVVTIGKQLYMSSMSNFSEEGGSFNKDKLLETFRTTLTSVVISESQISIITSKNIDINYSQYGKEYKLQVNAESNSFTIESNGTVIFDSN